MAQSRSDPKKYMLTAGHCLHRDASLVVRTRTANGDLKRLGYWHNGNAGAPGDWAIARISNRRFGWQPRNLVFVRANANVPIPTTRNELYEIRGDAASEMDGYVCPSGQMSATVCGYVDKLNVGSAPGATRATYRSAKGDSGGPVYIRNRAHGVHYAGGTVDGAQRGYFTEVRESENALNVNVLTS